MKLVIYEQNETLCVTTAENYKARIQNARAVNRMTRFHSAEEVIAYYCKYLGCKAEDFEVRL